MKIILKKLDSVIVWGTNNNNTTVELIGDNFVVDGKIIATGVTASNYELIEKIDEELPSDFFVGYTEYKEGVFNHTQNYILFNTKTHNCLTEIKEIYLFKSEDSVYNEEERLSFKTYADELDLFLSRKFIEPQFVYPIPPDETYPFIPTCSI
jgi:hypothetical protein